MVNPRKTLYKRTKNRYNRKKDGVKRGRVREQNTAHREFPVC